MEQETRLVLRRDWSSTCHSYGVLGFPWIHLSINIALLTECFAPEPSSVNIALLTECFAQAFHRLALEMLAFKIPEG